jgi:hypothetical protein
VNSPKFSSKISPKPSILFSLKDSPVISQINLPKILLKKKNLLKPFSILLTPENSRLLLEHLMVGNIPQQQPPPLPPRVFNISVARYSPLNLPRKFEQFSR